MNKNHAYAYLLLGAVVLAGLGGFMLSDYSLTEDVTTPTSMHTTNMTITISEHSSEMMEETEENGQDS